LLGAWISERRIVTLSASITIPPSMCIAAMTVPGVVMERAPERVRTVPAGTPVFVASG
jgi:hypothetical protein